MRAAKSLLLPAVYLLFVASCTTTTGVGCGNCTDQHVQCLVVDYDCLPSFLPTPDPGQPECSVAIRSGPPDSASSCYKICKAEEDCSSYVEATATTDENGITVINSARCMD